MEAKLPEPNEFRAGQRESWNTAAAGWRKHNELIDQSSRHISERLVELAGVGAGNRVLDVAAGYGEPSLTAAKVVGAEGAVAATDISAEMLAYGRERAEAAGLENIEFVESAAIALDFPAGSFDAALSRWGIIFDPDGEGAAGRVREMLKPGGRFAIASWGPPERVPFLSLPMKTVMEKLGVPPPPPGMPGPLSRPTPEALGGLLEGGGFTGVEVEEGEVTFEWESPEQVTEFAKEIAPPIHALMAGHSEEEKDAAWDAITEAVRDHAGDDGRVRFTSLALLASGEA